MNVIESLVFLWIKTRLNWSLTFRMWRSMWLCKQATSEPCLLFDNWMVDNYKTQILYINCKDGRQRCVYAPILALHIYILEKPCWFCLITRTFYTCFTSATPPFPPSNISTNQKFQSQHLKKKPQHGQRRQQSKPPSPTNGPKRFPIWISPSRSPETSKLKI